MATSRSIVALSGLGNTAPRTSLPTWIVWGSIVGVSALIFYGTLRAPKRRRA